MTDVSYDARTGRPVEEIATSTAAVVDAALAAAAAAPTARPADIFNDVYDELPERVRRQRRELVGDE